MSLYKIVERDIPKSEYWLDWTNFQLFSQLKVECSMLKFWKIVCKILRLFHYSLFSLWYQTLKSRLPCYCRNLSIQSKDGARTINCLILFIFYATGCDSLDCDCVLCCIMSNNKREKSSDACSLISMPFSFCIRQNNDFQKMSIS